MQHKKVSGCTYATRHCYLRECTTRCVSTSVGSEASLTKAGDNRDASASKDVLHFGGNCPIQFVYLARGSRQFAIAIVSC